MASHAIFKQISQDRGVPLNNFFDPLNLLENQDGAVLLEEEEEEEVHSISLVRHRVYHGQKYVHDPSFYMPIPDQKLAPTVHPRLPPPLPPPPPLLPPPPAAATGTPIKVTSWVLFFLAFVVVWWYYRIIS